MISKAILDTDIRNWIAEDVPFWDVSFIDDQDREVSGYIVAKSTGILAGIEVAKRIFGIMEIRVLTARADGDYLEPGEKFLTFEGKASDILIAERLVLNILSHMSAIATKTNELTTRLRTMDLKTKIAATRKTLPGFRKYQKWAVVIGGGDTHRLNLSAMVLIKENHVATYNGIRNSILAIRERVSFSHKIEIEVRNRVEALEAAETGVDIIMLDNFDPDMIPGIIEEIREIDPKVLVEASGGITEDNYVDYAARGVDIISMGSLTHSVRIFDMSLLLNEVILPFD
ncbi:MAG: carboxylating nicotinate-nucleotide diphosphorylase [Candidatus Kariarchaeaceae archaeon]|jgi:nicotinate-nucleotide pyrophosphorylase (carboxylating)